MFSQTGTRAIAIGHATGTWSLGARISTKVACRSAQNTYAIWDKAIDRVSDGNLY